MLNYICIESYIPNTASEHISNTTKLFPESTQIPRLPPEKSVRHYTYYLTEYLQNTTP